MDHYSKCVIFSSKTVKKLKEMLKDDFRYSYSELINMLYKKTSYFKMIKIEINKLSDNSFNFLIIINREYSYDQRFIDLNLNQIIITNKIIDNITKNDIIEKLKIFPDDIYDILEKDDY
jgi:hypothetical protein